MVSQHSAWAYAALAAGALAIGIQPAVAQSGQAAAQSAGQHPNLSGIWVRTDEVGSGSFGGMLDRLAKAELKPAAKAAAEQEAARQKEEEAKLLKSENGVYKTPARCAKPGIVFMMQHSGGLDIVQDKDEILVIAEEPSTQHIYMDGRPHPSPANWQPSGTGHSIGRWDGSTLVVDTIGMDGGGTGGIPGGGRKGPKTQLVQRFTLRDPTHLVVTFTWNDDEIYVRPHSYEFTYEKQPSDSYSFESWCDVTDPLQGQSIVIPPK